MGGVGQDSASRPADPGPQGAGGLHAGPRRICKTLAWGFWKRNKGLGRWCTCVFPCGPICVAPLCLSHVCVPLYVSPCVCPQVCQCSFHEPRDWNILSGIPQWASLRQSLAALARQQPNGQQGLRVGPSWSTGLSSTPTPWPPSPAFPEGTGDLAYVGTARPHPLGKRPRVSGPGVPPVGCGSRVETGAEPSWQSRRAQRVAGR